MMQTEEIEIAVAKFLNLKANIIVPNVRYGMDFQHECDIFMITKSGYGYEVEIKISKQDLMRDFKKKNGHKSNKIGRLFYAMPEYMEDCISLIPEYAGILIAKRCDGKVECYKVRNAKKTSSYRFTEKEQMHLARLGTMRIWKLKKLINAIQTEAEMMEIVK